MERSQILGIIIMCCCCFGSGLIFLFVGIHADRSKTPVGFWSGFEVKAEFVRDIAGYNKENARMWKCYCIPYFLAGIAEILSCVHEAFLILCIIMLILAALPGIPILIRHYRKIEIRYMEPKKLDKIDPFC